MRKPLLKRVLKKILGLVGFASQQQKGICFLLSFLCAFIYTFHVDICMHLILRPEMDFVEGP